MSLSKWFRERWVDLSRPKPGGGYEPCGREEGGERKRYPKCVPAAKAAKLSEAERKSAIRRKRSAVAKARSLKAPTYVETFAKLARAKGR